jgi:predicted dehydrogenase
MTRIRIGIVGTSNYMERVHVPLLAAHPQADLVGVCGRRPDHTTAFAARHAIPHAFFGLDEMLAADGIDAVVIATPDDLHHRMTLAALNAGKHVLCEKPLALNAAQAREMLDHAAASRLKHMVFFRWRWLPQVERMRELVATGWIGNPQQLTLRYLANYGRRPGYAWRFDELRANGVLGDLGSHMIDFALWLGGDIHSVSADLSTSTERFASDRTRVLKGNDQATLLLRFAGGAQGVIQLSSVAELGDEPQELSIEVLGDEGFLSLSFPRSIGPTLRGARKGRSASEIEVVDEARGALSYDLGLQQEWSRRSVADRLFVDAIVGDTPLTPSFVDGVRAQEVIDAAIASHAGRLWVAVQRSAS